MPFDPENPKNVQRLVDSFEKSLIRMRKHRNMVRKMKKVYAGHLYSDEGSQESVPVNLLEQLVNIYTRNLVPNVPKAFVTVIDSSLLARRTQLEVSLNFLAEILNMKRAISDSVFEAQFLMGIAKVGLGGVNIPPGKGLVGAQDQPFIKHVQLENWVHEYFASGSEDTEYCGDRSFKNAEEVKDTYPEHADEISVVTWSDEEPEDESTAPIATRASDAQRVQDYAEIWELFYRPDNLLLRMPGGRDGLLPIVLEAKPWRGPTGGPFHQLGFTWIPGSTIPLSPVATLGELAHFHDALFAKTHDQAEEQKTVLAARRAHHKDAQKIATAGDLEVVTADDPTMIKEFRLGGADPQTLEMARLTRELFSSFAGNLELLGGLSAQSETLGQDRLLAANASKRMQSMQTAVREFTQGIFEDIGWWLWTDPDTVIKASRPGYNDSNIAITFGPEDRVGDFYEFNVDVNPYSAVVRTPQEEAQLMMTMAQQLFFPVGEQMSAQGAMIDWVKFINRMGELYGMKTMDEYILYLGKQSMPKSTATGNPPTPQTKVGGNGKAGEGSAFGGGETQRLAAAMRMASGNGGRQGQ